MQILSQKKKTILLITLFASGTIIMSEMILTPTINLLYSLYPDGTNLINYAITGCYIFSTLASLVIGKLCEKISKKTLLLSGAVMGSIGGVGMFVTAAPMFLAVWRTLLMVSYAITMTISLSLINDMYDTDAQRGKMIGFYNAATTGFGALLSFAAGSLATVSLRSAYSLNFLILLYTIMVIFFVPHISPDKLSATDTADEKSTTGKGKMGGVYWTININYSFYTLAFCTFMYFSSVYISENNLGTEAFAGIISSIITITGFVTSLIYAKVFEKLGKNIETVSYAISALGIALVWLYPSVWSLCVGAVLEGGACCLVKVFHYAFLPTLVDENKGASAVAFVEATTMIAVLVTTYFVTYAMQLLNLPTFTSFLPITLGIMAINTIVGAIAVKKAK